MIKKSIIIYFVTIVLAVVAIALCVRGRLGVPLSSELNDPKWKENSGFDLSVERGRFALVYSLLEDKSFYLNPNLARFSTPDIGFINDRYVSLFAPGVSFITVPGYLIGKFFGASQVGTFFVIGIFGVLNLIMISLTARLLGASTAAGILGGVVFLFATPAFTYATTLYQHHISTFLILTAIYTLTKWRSVKSLSLVWFICGVGISVDFPNFFMLAPIGLYALSRFFSITKDARFLRVKFKLAAPLTLVTIIAPIIFLGWFNYNSYGSPTQLGGTVKSISGIDELGKPLSADQLADQTGLKFNEAKEKKSSIGFFRTRSILNGLYVHFLSPDRGIIFFAPIVLVGLLGVRYGLQKNKTITQLMLVILSVNITLYSMWGDPWGGWAFGSRYLIPTYSLLAIFIGIALTQLRHNFIFVLIFVLVNTYSVAINSAGAITSNANPPQIQVLSLEQITGRQEKYRVDRNFDNIFAGNLRPVAYWEIAQKNLSGIQYYLLVAGLVTAIWLFLVVMIYV